MSRAATSAQLEDVLAPARALLIDFDGPICHLFAGHPASDIADAVRVRTPDLAEVRSADPLVLLCSAYQLSPELGRDVEAFVVDHETRATSTARPTPGAHDAIHAASRAGVPVLVVSNNAERAIRTYLGHHDLSRHVAHVTGRPFGQPDHMKPAAALVEAALDVAHVNPPDALFVGDSITDVLAGAAANVPTIGYAKSADRSRGLADAGAPLVLDSMTALAAALNRR